MKCPKCQQDNREEAIFCLRWGAEPPAGAVFCDKCGNARVQPGPMAAAPCPPKTRLSFGCSRGSIFSSHRAGADRICPARRLRGA